MISDKINTAEPFAEVYEKPVKIGVVFDCEKLNVRAEPSAIANIITTIERGTEVVVVEEESTDDFYKVCLVSGVYGFCMKSFIAV